MGTAADTPDGGSRGVTEKTWRPFLAGIVAAAFWGFGGCATTPEAGWDAFAVEGVEEPIFCSGGCEEEWRRAEEWAKKYSGYAFPSEVVVTEDRIEALRSGALECDFFDRTRRHRPGVGCVEFPLASEPLGPINPPPDPLARGSRAAADSHPTFLILREELGDGRSRVRLAQLRARSESEGRAASRQDSFRRFVRTGWDARRALLPLVADLGPLRVPSAKASEWMRCAYGGESGCRR